MFELDDKKHIFIIIIQKTGIGIENCYFSKYFNYAYFNN